MSQPELSIIIPTLGRKIEFENLLLSLKKSILRWGKTYEILVIDQNQDGLIDEVCNKYQSQLKLIQYKVNFNGLSKAKNFGSSKASGKYICFPDDDAELLENTIDIAINCLINGKADCVFGKCIDKQTKEDSILKFKSEATKLTLDNFEGGFVEATMFAKTQLLSDFKFDEKMGAGRLFGSQEGYDLVYRLLKANKNLIYTPEILFYHPNKVNSKNSSAEIRRAFYYSCGFGFLCKKHHFERKYYKRYLLLSFALGPIWLLKRGQYKYYKAQKLGLFLGHSGYLE